MLSHPNEPDAYLLSVDDLDDEYAMPPAARAHATALRTVAAWAREYLAEPHPDLGRGGPVCPYVTTSLNRRLFYLTVCPIRSGEDQNAHVSATVASYRDWFVSLEPLESIDAIYKTILILFPDVSAESAPGVIDVTQARLKPSFVDAGLMLGQFHGRPPVDGGLWNPAFRPLRAPVSLLAIRQMVPADLPFLLGDRRLLDAYQHVFGDNLPARHRRRLAEERARLDQVTNCDRGARAGSSVVRPDMVAASVGAGSPAGSEPRAYPG